MEPIFFADPDWYNTPIDYEVINGTCNYCGGNGDYIDYEMLGHIRSENEEDAEGFWICRSCETYNMDVLQGTLEV